MECTDPRDFDAEYVRPAVRSWMEHHSEPHLAIHAITQFDVLAEVAALWTLLEGREELDRGQASRFRDELGSREPALAVVRDVHDCHKHGRLRRTGNTFATQGQRPAMAQHAGFFVGVSFVDGPPTIYNALSIQLDDGTSRKVLDILNAARAAWYRELKSGRIRQC